MRRRTRVWILVGYLAAGGFLTQLGSCWIIGANTLLPRAVVPLIDDSGNLFSLFNVCGVPDVIAVDQNGNPIGAVMNAEDDLVTVCPVTGVTTTTGGGTGTGGGGV